MKKTTVLIVSVFIAGLCSIVYELLISTVSSYFLGNSVLHFSLTIGVYMAAMGFGSYLSRLVGGVLLVSFVYIEILLGFIGGISVPCLYLAYAYTDHYYVFMFSFIFAIGTLIGLEIPLLARLMERYYQLKVNISNVLSVDYLGALVATLLFPFVLMPFVGTFKSSLFFGLVNMLIGFSILWGFRDELDGTQRRKCLSVNALVFFSLFGLLIGSQVIVRSWQSSLYEDRIVFQEQSKYQRIVFTKYKRDLRLFLDGNLQFSAIDEYRYHEALVHIPMHFTPLKKRVLILGGGDGLVAREVLKHPQVESIDLVDLDRRLVEICRSKDWITKLNGGSLSDARMKLHHMDALKFLDRNENTFNLILADLPDPNNASLARLYSREFFKLVKRNLSRDGVFCTQATSPFFANKSFWCIERTVKASGFRHTAPYHTYIPSFGDWGFVMASDLPLTRRDFKFDVPTKYLDDQVASNLFHFEKDLRDQNPEYSTLDKPVILTYYLQDWQYWK